MHGQEESGIYGFSPVGNKAQAVEDPDRSQVAKYRKQMKQEVLSTMKF